MFWHVVQSLVWMGVKALSGFSSYWSKPKTLPTMCKQNGFWFWDFCCVIFASHASWFPSSHISRFPNAAGSASAGQILWQIPTWPLCQSGNAPKDQRHLPEALAAMSASAPTPSTQYFQWVWCYVVYAEFVQWNAAAQYDMNRFQLNHSQLKVGTILWMFATQMQRLMSDGYSFDTRLAPVCLILPTLCVPSWMHWAMHCNKLYGHCNLNLCQRRLKGQSDWQMVHRWTVNIIPLDLLGSGFVSKASLALCGPLPRVHWMAWAQKPSWIRKQEPSISRAKSRHTKSKNQKAKYNI